MHTCSHLCFIFLLSLLSGCGSGGGSGIGAGSCTISGSYITKAVGVQPVAVAVTTVGTPSVPSPTAILPSNSTSNSTSVLSSNGSSGNPVVLPSNGNSTNTSSVLPSSGSGGAASGVTSTTTGVGSNGTSSSSTPASSAGLALLDSSGSSVINSSPGAYDRLTYQAVFSSSCLQVVSDYSGGFYYRIDVTASQSVGYLESVDFGTQRSETFASGGSSQYSLSGGATDVERTYQSATAASLALSQWLLPWPTPPQYANITIMLPTGSQTSLYPTVVNLQLEATNH